MKAILLLLLIPLISTGQGLKQADKSYLMLDYANAVSGYEKYISKSKDKHIDIELIKKIANSYYKLQTYEKAKSYYYQLYTIQGNDMDEELFVRLLNSLRITKEMEKANELFISFYSKNNQRIKTFRYQKNKLDSLESEFNSLVNLSINSKNSDFGVSMYGKDVVFSSSRGDLEKSIDQTASYYNIYKATRNTFSGQLSNEELFLSNLNTSFNDATPVFNKDLNIVFFSRNFITKNHKLDAKDGEISNVMIMKAYIQNNQLIDITPLSFNSKKYNCSHPFVSADGKFLFFASDMPGGFGESDIYMTELNNDGTTGTPINLGPIINTSGTEMFPSISGDTLFFSSNFHYGLGGLDVFFSKIGDGNKFSIPENLGSPINTNKDDFSFLKLNDRTGYFSSNRDGGRGEDDIYWFDMIELKRYIAYDGFVLSKGDDTPVSDAVIKVYDDYNELILEAKSTDEGKYNIMLPCDAQLKLIYSKPEFSTETLSLHTPSRVEKSSDNNVRLTSFSSLIKKEDGLEKIKVEPIYFEYNKWDITPQAETELNKIVYAMETFPNIKIKIEAHTDARGADNYNLKLSDNRAKSTQQYLISKGITSSRIESAIGYGETRLKNKCKNGVKCTEDEHFVNRRSDFIVINK